MAGYSLTRLGGGPSFGGLFMQQWLHDLCDEVRAEIRLNLHRLSQREKRQLQRAFQNGYLVGAETSRVAVVYKHFCRKHGLPYRVLGAVHKNVCETGSALAASCIEEFRASLMGMANIMPDGNSGARAIKRAARYGTRDVASVSSRGPVATLIFSRPSRMSAAAFMDSLGSKIFPKPPEDVLLAALSDFISTPYIVVRIYA